MPLLSSPLDGGGFGGNLKMGKVIYDGLKEHLPKLNVIRDAETKTCYLKNSEYDESNLELAENSLNLCLEV